MKFDVANIDLFEEFSDVEQDDVYLDFHNDFICYKLLFESSDLILSLKKRHEKYDILFKFTNISIVRIEFEHFSQYEFTNLTIETLYRGRFEKNGELCELENGKGYLYLYFIEGLSLEFFCESIEILKQLIK